MILGIDLGQKTTGLAISNGVLATPYKTITHKNTNQVLSSIIQIIELESIKIVVLGYVPGKISTLFENFARRLKELKPDLEIVMWDETLTTRQAQETMIKLQIPKKKKKKLEHEYSAAIILQSYLDEND